MKILSVFGTRPEAIKMAPVITHLTDSPDKFTSVVCVTAQHREMLDQVLDLFHIKPQYDLSLMQPNQSLPELTARSITKIDEVLQAEQPDWVFVQGDTTTAMVAALAAFYRKIKVGHVEAGLRSFDNYQPFPEEINRRIISTISHLNFAPTQISADNLVREGVDKATIEVTGNTVIDALLQVSELPYNWDSSPLSEIPLDKKIILVTAHRRENFGKPLENICAALRNIAAKHSDVHLVYPVHLNPNVQQTVFSMLQKIENITLLSPLEYLPLVKLMKQSYLVLTDSGGIQEEAPSLGKPVLVLRDVTERPEGVIAGTVKLVGTNPIRIISEIDNLLSSKKAYNAMAQARNPYGDGHAGNRIIARLMN